jgi:hypothetical protein
MTFDLPEQPYRIRSVWYENGYEECSKATKSWERDNLEQQYLTMLSAFHFIDCIKVHVRTTKCRRAYELHLQKHIPAEHVKGQSLTGSQWPQKTLYEKGLRTTVFEVLNPTPMSMSVQAVHIQLKRTWFGHFLLQLRSRKLKVALEFTTNLKTLQFSLCWAHVQNRSDILQRGLWFLNTQSCKFTFNKALCAWLQTSAAV